MIFGKKSYSKPSFINRVFRSVISITILTAFVLGISFFVKELSSMDMDKIVALSAPILSKLGVSEEKAGKVAGAFAKRILNTDIDIEPASPVADTEETPSIGEGSNSVRKKEVLKVAIMSDSEDDNATLQRALFEASNAGVQAVFHLGDLTQFGTTDSLEEAKAILESGKLVYYALPGDHDLYKSVGSQNFEQVFGQGSEVVTLNGIKFVMLDNSANYTLIPDERMAWFEEQIVDADFVLLSQPIYHPSPSVLSPVMGMVNGEIDTAVYDRRGKLLELVEKSGVIALFAGDHHRSNSYDDPADDTLTHFTVGAINESKKLQSPRFSVLTVYDTGEYGVSEILLD